MWGLLGSLFTGGAGLLGSMFSSNSNAQANAQNVQAQMAMNQANIAMQRETNEMNVNEAQKNRAFQEQMSNTAYQRSSQDMKAAGLNPMMMFGSGGAASSPSGGVPSLTAPRGEAAKVNPTRAWDSLGDTAAKAVNSAVQVKTMDKMSDEMANLEVENTRLRKLTEQVSAATATERKRTELVAAETKGVEQDTLSKKLDRARQEWEAIKYLDLSNIPDVARKAGNIAGWGGGKLSDTLAPLVSSARAVKSLLPVRSTSQRSRVDSKGNSFDEFWENRTGFGR